MAEVIAGLSLAANVLQMVEFGTQFVTVAWKIWDSGQESLDGINHLQQLSKDLKHVLNRLQLDDGQPSTSDADASLFELVGECVKVSEHLLKTLNDIGVDRVVKKRGAIQAAFRLAWKNNDIERLQKTLDRFRTQLTLGLVVSLRAYAMNSTRQQEDIIDRLGKLQSRSKAFIDDRKALIHQNGPATLIIELLSQNQELHQGNSSQPLMIGRTELLGNLLQAFQSQAKSQDEIDKYTFGLSYERKRTLQKRSLADLKYDGMVDREDQVKDAHAETFKWILEENRDQERRWSNFCTWLESNQQLYWITGKAGCGKSTMMKYLCQRIPLGDFGSTHDEAPGFDSAPSRCEVFLRRWAGDQELIIASFYFWSSGSEMQASRSGLYRTLLFQMLQQRPELISRVSPERWSVLCVFDTDLDDFTEEDLLIMFHRTVAEICSTGKLCLFVDGLDEFHGQPDELVQLFRTIVMDNPTIKICIASRSWVVFEQAFGNKPHLMLEDLTYKDIKDYITSHFNEDANFCVIQSQQPQQAEQFVEEIMRKAEGIFLWVYLVVFSLLVGINPGDRVSDLQRRLETLEPGLQGLYDRIVDKLNPLYLEQATQYFQLMRTSLGDPPALLFSFAIEEDPDFAIKLPIGALSTEQIQLRVEATRRRINSRCKGLLELGRGAYNAEDSRGQVPTVRYLHRTVKDYLDTPEVWTKLVGAVDVRFDPQFKLCKASLALYKVSPHGGTRTKLLNPDDLMEGQKIPALSRCMIHAAEVHQDHILGMINVLDELKKSQMIVSPRLFLDSHRVKPGRLFTSRFGPCFLSLAVKYGVVEYVKTKLEPGCLVDRSDGCIIHTYERLSKRRWTQPKTWLKSKLETSESPKWPLLLDAINSTGPKSPSMTSMLLQNQADPNFLIDSESASFKLQVHCRHLSMTSR